MHATFRARRTSRAPPTRAPRVSRTGRSSGSGIIRRRTPSHDLDAAVAPVLRVPPHSGGAAPVSHRVPSLAHPSRGRPALYVVVDESKGTRYGVSRRMMPCRRGVAGPRKSECGDLARRSPLAQTAMGSPGRSDDPCAKRSIGPSRAFPTASLCPDRMSSRFTCSAGGWKKCRRTSAAISLIPDTASGQKRLRKAAAASSGNGFGLCDRSEGSRSNSWRKAPRSIGSRLRASRPGSGFRVIERS
jgi:hypothetical protein